MAERSRDRGRNLSALEARTEASTGKGAPPVHHTSGGGEDTLIAAIQRSGIPREELEDKERTSTTNLERRVAEFNWEQFRRSVFLNAPTDIALTCADYFTAKNRKARRFDQLSFETREFVEEMERVACAPVSLIAVRLHYRSIIDRRTW